MRSFGPPSAHYRSPDLSAIRGALLSGSRIRHYMLAGFYGAERQREVEEERKKPKKREKVFSADDISLAVNLLNSI